MKFTSLSLLGRMVSLQELANYQMITDFPSLLPYEVARRFGNLRMDWMLGAADANNSVPFWVEGHGLFEVERIRAGLQNAGFQVEVESDHITTDQLPFGISMRLGREGFRLHRANFTAEANDDRRIELLAVGLGGGEAIWIHAPVDSELLAQIDIGPMKPLSVTATVSFQEGIAVTLSAEHADAASASTLGGMLEGLRGQSIAQLQRLTEEGGVSLARAIEILEGITIEPQRTRLEVRASLGALAPDDVAELMRRLGLR